MTTQVTNIDIQDWTVADGPSREELFDSLRLYNEHRFVKFVLNAGPGWDNYDIVGQIRGISPEDGSGHNWMLEVGVDYGEDSLLQPRHRGPYTLYYNDVRRKGHVSDATPPQERIRVRGGEIWLGGQKIGDIPNLV